MYFEHNGMSATKNMQRSWQPEPLSGPPGPGHLYRLSPPHTGLCIFVQRFTLTHWIGTQKRGTRTGPNGLCGDRNTDSVFVFLMLFCSHWQAGAGVLTPLAHFCTAYGLHISRQKKLRAAENIWRRWQLFIWFQLLCVLLKTKRPYCLPKSARPVPVPSPTNIHILTPQQHVQVLF